MDEKTEVKIINGTELNSVWVDNDESLLSVLIQKGYFVQSPCGGNGICGKCKVRVLEGKVPVNSEDKKIFTDEELEDGWRLSCTLYPANNLKIALEQNDETQFEVVSVHNVAVGKKQKSGSPSEQEYDIAIDIGTTTLAFELIHEETGEVLHAVTSVNSQRKYGADVVSRIQASVEGRKEELQESIQKDLELGIRQLVQEFGTTVDKVKKIVIAGNTTMIHLLMGYDCSGLGVYPFTPVNSNMICEEKVTILPGICAFIGGDIVSGLYAHGFAENDDICLLIDLGTNGEMALGNKDRILVTSTAAGPAFEGGNISCGTGSVAGAVCSVEIQNNNIQIKTIQGKPPCGICGTGVIEIVSELLKNKIIDETGLLTDEYFDDGFPIAKTVDGKSIVLTQKDIRELQLAKAAVRAGVEVLLKQYGITAKQVDKVYLAGGFGYRLDVKKTAAIGILPEELTGKIEVVGNSSLGGCIKYLCNGSGEDSLKKIRTSAESIILANDVDFEKIYMENMSFSL